MNVLIKKFLKLRLIFLFPFFINGCIRTYYPAIYNSSAPPIIYETNNNLELSSNYLGADYTISQGSYENETLQLMRVNYINAYTKDHTNFNLEGFGYIGNYKVSGLSLKYDGNKSFIGVGGDLKFNINFKFGKVKLGTGFNFGLGLECGEYYEFRKSAGNENIIDDENSLIFLMFSGNPMICYEFSESTILSAQVNVGMPGLLSPSIVLNNERFVYWITWFPNKNISDNNYGQRITFGIMIGLNNLDLKF